MDHPYHKPSEVWLLSSEVTVVQATLLVLNIEPQGLMDVVEGLPSAKKPRDYVAVKSAILTACVTEMIDATLVREKERTIDDSNLRDLSAFDANLSTVDVLSLQVWAAQSGFSNTGLFSSDEASVSFENKEHPRYSAKLAGAVAAWKNFEDVESGPGTVKQRLEKWLRMHANDFGFVDDDGNPQETVVKELAKVANWEVSGGAPKSGDRLSEAD